MMRNLASKLFVLLFLAVNLRGSLGYIFRFGDPAASPTYSERPVAFFILWNILTWLMLILVAYKVRKLSIKCLAIFLVSLIFSLICLSQAESFNEAESFLFTGAARGIILYGFFFLCLYSNGSWVKISHINKAIEFMAVFGLGFLFYQIYQNHYFGVLPAHSHEGLLIRYGSFYDDSLALGILLPMFAGYFFNKYHKSFPSLLTAAIVCLVAILTGSLTAIGINLIYIAWCFRKRYKLLFFFLCVCLISPIYFIDQINLVLQFKSGSIEGHLGGWNYFKDIGLLNLTGFSAFGNFVESGYILFLSNFGVQILIIVLVFHFATLRACRVILLSSVSSREQHNFTGAAQGLTISVLLANLNLPSIAYPPVYLIVAIFSAIVLTLQRDIKINLPMVSSRPRMIFSRIK